MALLSRQSFSTPHISRCLSNPDLEEERIPDSMFLQTSSRACSPRLGFLLLKVPLIAILISTIIAAVWVTVWIFHMDDIKRISNHRPTANRIVYPCEHSRLTVGRDNCLLTLIRDAHICSRYIPHPSRGYVAVSSVVYQRPKSTDW